ncbi:MAG: hypothetical protein A4S09_13290 [Proteobacteria bacterium SG_bin7]|nr:MAG: hypothetical protein A4S09_13290 [Proteobacteria bacterium SG_bin7]
MILLLSLLIGIARADLCNQWGPSEYFGNVPQIADEASGLIYSRQFSNRLYHVNDGKSTSLIVSNAEGTVTKEISIDEVKLHDVEELAYGSCPDDNKKYCIYIGDIGDNGRQRSFIQVVVVREEEKFSDSIKPLAVYRMHYSDGPHNSEAMAIHRDGSLYIVTKEKKNGVAHSAKIFRNSIFKPQGELTLIGELDLPYLSKNQDVDDQVVTGLTISDDSRRFILMSYRRAWEFNLDLSESIISTKKLRLGVDYQPIVVGQLPQQEAITYLPDQKSFIYSTEAGEATQGQSVNIVRCLE